VVLTFTVVAGIIFAWMNFKRGLTGLASVELIVACISLWLWLHVKKTQSVAYFKRLIMIYILVFYSIMMFTFTVDGVSITIFIWALSIPLISYLLLGTYLGFVLTAFFYVLTAWLFFAGFTAHPIMIEKVAYANIIICALLFWGISHSYQYANQLAQEKLQRMAVSDHLTGLYNRTVINEMFESHVEQATENNEKVSLVLFDLDGFKDINDRFGHDVGDRALIQFAQVLQQTKAGRGVYFRVGGEEFAGIYSTQSELDVLLIVESIRGETERIALDHPPSKNIITVSAGVVIEKPEQAKLNQMMSIADRRMYMGKKQGRNVVVHSDQ